ncbi:MAG: hypothetical protein HC778_02935 [Chamaesiphon sp. CSU_1_12]|nr:hypothetical protein [Chamaesiphon sp. CSU_1_12]
MRDKTADAFRAGSPRKETHQAGFWIIPTDESGESTIRSYNRGKLEPQSE